MVQSCGFKSLLTYLFHILSVVVSLNEIQRESIIIIAICFGFVICDVLLFVACPYLERVQIVGVFVECRCACEVVRIWCGC